MLKGQAKKDYQREYMREYRLKKQGVRPSKLDPSRGIICGGGSYVIYPAVQPIYIEPSVGSSDGITQAYIIELDADGNPVYNK